MSSNEQKINVNEWLANFKSGKYNYKDLDTQIEAGWFDWFCCDRNLHGRLIKMASKVKKFVETNNKLPISERKFNPETSYVFFKNNQPMSGGTYDDFRICDMKSGNVIFTVVAGRIKTNTRYPIGRSRKGVLQFAKMSVSEIWGEQKGKEGFQQLAEGTWTECIKTFFGNIK